MKKSTLFQIVAMGFIGCLSSSSHASHHHEYDLECCEHFEKGMHTHQNPLSDSSSSFSELKDLDEVGSKMIPRKPKNWGKSLSEKLSSQRKKPHKSYTLKGSTTHPHKPTPSFKRTSVKIQRNQPKKLDQEFFQDQKPETSPQKGSFSKNLALTGLALSPLLLIMPYVEEKLHWDVHRTLWTIGGLALGGLSSISLIKMNYKPDFSEK